MPPVYNELEGSGTSPSLSKSEDSEAPASKLTSSDSSEIYGGLQGRDKYLPTKRFRVRQNLLATMTKRTSEDITLNKTANC